MAEQDGANGDEVQGLVLGAGNAPAFTDLVDMLVANEDRAEAEAGGEAPAPAAAGDGSPAVAGEGALAAPAAAGAQGAGAAGEPGVSADGAVVTEPAVPHANAEAPDAADLAPKFAEIFTGLEERQSQSFQAAALNMVREEHSKHFEAIEKHPRELVGSEVPNVVTGNMEILRDSEDAREWQEAVKRLLKEEVQARVAASVEQAKPMMETLHASSELFQKNADLLPGTRQFDVELATEFVKVVKPYEQRVEGKLIGYTIPVQPLLDHLRSQVTARRAAAAAPAAPSPQAQRAAEQARTPTGQFAGEAPQAGIPSRAGNSASEPNDFSTLFATAGLPNFNLNI